MACERGWARARRDSARARLPGVRAGAHRPQRDVAGLVGGGQHGRRRARVKLQVHDARGDHLRGAAAGALGGARRVARRAPRRALADAHARGTPVAGPRAGGRCAGCTGAPGVSRLLTYPPEARRAGPGREACMPSRAGQARSTGAAGVLSVCHTEPVSTLATPSSPQRSAATCATLGRSAAPSARPRSSARNAASGPAPSLSANATSPACTPPSRDTTWHWCPLSQAQAQDTLHVERPAEARGVGFARVGLPSSA